MDWKYKHFHQEAIFSAPHRTVTEAARAVAAEFVGSVQDTDGGFTAKGYGAWHAAVEATFHVTSVAEGTQVAVDLLVQRAMWRGYMLVDIGGYYNAQMDKWFRAISEKAGSGAAPALVSTTTSSSRTLQGCGAGCIAWVLVGSCLTLLAIPLDNVVFRQSAGSSAGPFGAVAALIGLLAGIGAFLYVMYPDAPAAKSIRERVQRTQNKQGQ